MASISVQESENEEMTQDHEEVPHEESSDQTPVEYQVLARRRPSKLLIGLIALIVIALVGGLVFTLRDRNQLKNQLNTLSQAQTQAKQPDSTAEAKELAAVVSKLIEVPTDELPTVATVVDASKVKAQAFFANAQNGDKVLLYTKASKAILYRPSTNKIVEVAPINIGNNQTSTTPTAPKKN